MTPLLSPKTWWDSVTSKYRPYKGKRWCFSGPACQTPSQPAVEGLYHQWCSVHVTFFLKCGNKDCCRFWYPFRRLWHGNRQADMILSEKIVDKPKSKVVLIKYLNSFVQGLKLTNILWWCNLVLLGEIGLRDPDTLYHLSAFLSLYNYSWNKI